MVVVVWWRPGGGRGRISIKMLMRWVEWLGLKIRSLGE